MCGGVDEIDFKIAKLRHLVAVTLIIIALCGSKSGRANLLLLLHTFQNNNYNRKNIYFIMAMC